MKGWALAEGVGDQGAGEKIWVWGRGILWRFHV